jgi:hypothetical protein
LDLKLSSASTVPTGEAAEAATAPSRETQSNAPLSGEAGHGQFSKAMALRTPSQTDPTVLATSSAMPEQVARTARALIAYLPASSTLSASSTVPTAEAPAAEAATPTRETPSNARHIGDAIHSQFSEATVPRAPSQETDPSVLATSKALIEQVETAPHDIIAHGLVPVSVSMSLRSSRKRKEMATMDVTDTLHTSTRRKVANPKPDYSSLALVRKTPHKKPPKKKKSKTKPPSPPKK